LLIITLAYGPIFLVPILERKGLDDLAMLATLGFGFATGLSTVWFLFPRISGQGVRMIVIGFVIFGLGMSASLLLSILAGAFRENTTNNLR
jgi:uncharacterized protein (DUF1810 family)